MTAPLEKTYHFILNPAAGSARSTLPALIREHFPDARLLPTQGPGDATRLAREAARTASDVVVACGGDGTFREAADGMGHGATLAHLPLGTVCLVAHALGIPREPRAALSLLLQGETRLVHPGLARTDDGKEHRFFLCVSAGPDADSVHLLSSAAKGRIGRYAYVLAFLRRLFAPFGADVRCEIGGESLRFGEAIFLRMPWYSGPFRASRSVSLFAPGLEFVGVGAGRLRILAFFLSLLLGGRLGYAGAVRRREETVRLHPPGGRLQIDGDAFVSERVEVTTAPPLLVLCGRKPRDEGSP